MAATFLLLLLALPAPQAAEPQPCQGGPASWCQDVATARRCQREQECHELWDSLAKQNVTDVDLADVGMADLDLAVVDLADGDLADVGMVAPGKGKKCKLCTKILEQMKAMAGENPDEAAVEAALAKGCRGLGRSLGRACKRLVRKYREELTEALLGAEPPRTACGTIGLCPA